MTIAVSQQQPVSDICVDSTLLPAPLTVAVMLDATASLLRTTRRVLYRDPYDLSLDVFTTRRVTRDESTGSVVSVDIDGQVLGGIRNRESLAPEVASISYDETDGTVNTIVPEANADHFFSGMIIDHRCHMYVDVPLPCFAGAPRSDLLI